MKASEQQISKFLATTKTVFSIPVYQRNYDWRREQCQQLFTDILEVGKNTKITAHFIGSIVYVHDDIYSVPDITELTIIDGQQRITTLILIYAVIRYLAGKQNNKNLQADIEETYLKNKFAPESEKLKLKSTENNKESLNFVLDFKDGNEWNGDHSRVIENFNFFKDKINVDNYEMVRLGLNKLTFVSIALDRHNDNPQRIFESMNSTGLDLSQADLIRNYILMELKRDKQEKLFKMYWEPIEKNAKDEGLDKNEVSRFIKDYLTSKNNVIPKEDEVHSTFKKQFSNKEEILNTILPELQNLSVFYNKLLNPKNEKEKFIRRELEYIKKLEMGSAYPFLINVYYDYSKEMINEEIFIDILKLLQSFIFRRLIAGAEVNSLPKIFMNLYAKVDKEKYLYSIQKALLQGTGAARFPKNNEVTESLKKREVYKFKAKNREYLFEKLENYNNNELVYLQDLTCEHIFPQNPDPKWLKELGKEEYDSIKEFHLHTIGNLTFSGNNGSLGNKTFIEKRDMNFKKAEQGYKFSRLWLNRDLQKLETWNKSEIEKRTKSLTNRFLDVWTIPDIQMDSVADRNEINIFEIESLEKRKIEYYIFYEQKKNVKSVTDFFKSLVRQLFELESEKFFNTEIKQELKITDDENEYKTDNSNILSHEKLDDEYYFCTHYGKNAILRRIKFILEIFGLEEDVFIKLGEE
jgi:uncharacterized protein with ParB-like and HNH nuclease domain